MDDVAIHEVTLVAKRKMTENDPLPIVRLARVS